jgi:hypothetical protein
MKAVTAAMAIAALSGCAANEPDEAPSAEAAFSLDLCEEFAESKGDSVRLSSALTERGPESVFVNPEVLADRTELSRLESGPVAVCGVVDLRDNTEVYAVDRMLTAVLVDAFTPEGASPKATGG